METWRLIAIVAIATILPANAQSDRLSVQADPARYLPSKPETYLFEGGGISESGAKYAPVLRRTVLSAVESSKVFGATPQRRKKIVPVFTDYGGGQGIVQFVSEESDGIAVVGINKRKQGEGLATNGLDWGDLAEPVDPPLYLLKKPIKAGTSWDFRGQLRTTIESVGETVTVPAGSFRDCIRVRVVGRVTQSGRELERDEVIWYAPELGVIKINSKYRLISSQEWQSWYVQLSHQ